MEKNNERGWQRKREKLMNRIRNREQEIEEENQIWNGMKIIRIEEPIPNKKAQCIIHYSMSKTHTLNGGFDFFFVL